MNACLHTLVCTEYVLGALRTKKKASDLLELELWEVVNHCVGAGNRTWVPGKSNKGFQLLSRLSRSQH